MNSLRPLLAIVVLTAHVVGPAPLRPEFIFDPNPVTSCHVTTIVDSNDQSLVAAWFGGTVHRQSKVQP